MTINGIWLAVVLIFSKAAGEILPCSWQSHGLNRQFAFRGSVAAPPSRAPVSGFA